MDLPSLGKAILSGFLGLLTIIIIVGIWLRTTVGKFVSNVSKSFVYSESFLIKESLIKRKEWMGKPF